MKIGNADDVEQKLKRLFIFYQQVLSKTGFDRYSVLDVQYKGQVLAIQKPANSFVDSIQLKKNLSLMMEKNKIDEDKLKQQLNTETELKLTESASTEKKFVPVKTNPKPFVKTIQKYKPVEKKIITNKQEIKKQEVKKKDLKKPKAVMTKTNDY